MEKWKDRVNACWDAYSYSHILSVTEVLQFQQTVLTLGKFSLFKHCQHAYGFNLRGNSGWLYLCFNLNLSIWVWGSISGVPPSSLRILSILLTCEYDRVQINVLCSIVFKQTSVCLLIARYFCSSSFTTHSQTLAHQVLVTQTHK